MNQKRYKQIQAAQIILATSIPVFSLIDDNRGRWIMAILGVSVAILAGFQQLGNYNDLWTTYRATAEQLRHEKFLFLAQSGPYRTVQGKEALRLLAERVEPDAARPGELLREANLPPPLPERVADGQPHADLAARDQQRDDLDELVREGLEQGRLSPDALIERFLDTAEDPVWVDLMGHLADFVRDAVALAPALLRLSEDR